MLISDETVQTAAALPVLETGAEEAWNPTKEFQTNVVGVSFQDAYDQAARFLNYIDSKTPLKENNRILDYGCGWGRMLKLLRMTPGFSAIELHGCDVNVYALEVVRKTIPHVYVAKCEPWPPTIYRDGSFSLIYAFSVFSHLREDAHIAWAKELARLTRPGGHAAITVQGAAYMKMCADFRSGATPRTHAWHEDMAASPFGTPEAAARYAAGEFLSFESLSPQIDKSYGEALVPRSYLESTWGALGFDLIDWDETHGQNWAVLKRR